MIEPNTIYISRKKPWLSDTEQVEVLFISPSHEFVAGCHRWLKLNCPNEYDWRFVPGSAYRRCYFKDPEIASSFVEYLMVYGDLI